MFRASVLLRTMPLGVLMMPLLASAADLSVATDGSGDYTTITEAIDAASTGDVITVHMGTYAETINPDGKDLTIRAAMHQNVIVDGEGVRQCMILADGETSAMVISRLKFHNGFTSGSGAVHCDGTSATFNQCTFYACEATNGGGGVYAEGGAPTFNDCTFTECVADDSNGGGALLVDSDATFDGCVFESCDGYSGGGAFVGGGGPVFVDCEFESCRADWTGGAAYVQNALPTLSGCTFSSCVSEGFNVGGLAILNGSGPITIDSCEFSANQAGTIGDKSVGALKLYNVDATVTNCTFDGNVAESTGGIEVGGESTVTLTGSTLSSHTGGAMRIGEANVDISDCTFNDNELDASGGGAIHVKGHLFHDAAQVTVADSSFTGNSARWGGGFYVIGEPTVPAQISLTSCTFDSCQASDQGGGVYLTNADATLTDCTFTGNATSDTPSYGGALVASDGSLVVSNCRLESNDCPSDYGHALFLGGMLTASLSDVSACDHPYDGEVWGAYTDGGGNDLGGWCCPGDVDQSGTVDGDDVIAFVDMWAATVDGDDRSDCDRDLDVDVTDLIGLLTTWGLCEG